MTEYLFDITRELTDAVRRTAHDEIMPRFLHAASRRKADGSLLTEADTAAQEMLARVLPEIVPVPVLGEEMDKSRQHELWAAHAESGLWVVDPIDGTNNFANGLPHFAVSAALVIGNRTRAGVVYDPIADEMFHAASGSGAFLNEHALPLVCSPKTLKEAIAGVEVKYLRSGKLAGRIHTLSPFGSSRSMGCSTLDWCYLAAGRYDVYVHGGQKLWDYAAGALIYEEAGGQLATLEGDEFWSGEHVFHRSAIAALRPELFECWLAWIRHNA